jgi:hypothetical protein
MDTFDFLQEVALGTSTDIDIHLNNNVFSVIFFILLAFQNDIRASIAWSNQGLLDALSFEVVCASIIGNGIGDRLPPD